MIEEEFGVTADPKTLHNFYKKNHIHYIHPVITGKLTDPEKISKRLLQQ